VRTVLTLFFTPVFTVLFIVLHIP